MTDRRACCIPGCRRTFKLDVCRDSDEIMCGRHWKMADQRLRDRHKTLRKRERKAVRLVQRDRSRPAAAIERLRLTFVRAELKAWEAVKADVIPKALLGAEDAPRRRGEL